MQNSVHRLFSSSSIQSAPEQSFEKDLLIHRQHVCVCVCVCVCADVMKNCALSKVHAALLYNNAGELRAAIDEYKGYATVEDIREIQAAEDILQSIDERRGEVALLLYVALESEFSVGCTSSQMSISVNNSEHQGLEALTGISVEKKL